MEKGQRTPGPLIANIEPPKIEVCGRAVEGWFRPSGKTEQVETEEVCSMHPFLSATVGGALIGLAAVMLMFLSGRIAGISGIVGALLPTG
jgi:hypothetical protein